MLKSFTILIFIFQIISCDQDDAKFLTDLNETLDVPVNVDIREKWTKLSLTQFQNSGYSSIFKNATHIAVEFSLPPAELTKPTSKLVKPKVQIPKTETYNKFVSLIKTFSKFLYVNPQDYQKFSSNLGEMKTFIISNEESNLSAYLLRPEENKDFTKMRYFISQAYKIKNLAKIFPGNRFGLRQFDEKVVGLYYKCFPEREDPRKTPLNQKCPITQMAAPDKTFEYSLIYRPQNELFIMELVINENDTPTIVKAKQRLIQSQSELILSKKLLRQFGLIGFHNTEDNAFLEASLFDSGKNSLLMMKYYSLFRNQKSFSKIESLSELKKICKRITDKPIEWDMLGVASPSLNREFPTFKLVAFETENEVNYVYDFINFSNYSNDNVLKNVREALNGYTNCSYHNDRYLTDQELDEMYMITFTVQKGIVKI
jgi:hypothetical protein